MQMIANEDIDLEKNTLETCNAVNANKTFIVEKDGEDNIASLMCCLREREMEA